MRVGLLVDGEFGLTVERWLELADAAASGGFDCLLRSDHLTGAPPDEGSPSRTKDCLDAWTLCAAAATRTTGLRVGTLVSPVTLRHPAVLAKTVETVSALSGGAVDLGLGIGWNTYEHVAHGIRFPSVGTRYRMLAEQLEILHGLWHGTEPFSFAGEFYRFEDCRFRPRDHAPRIVIGKRGRPRSVALAARWADDYNLVFETEERCGETRWLLDAACAAIGRDRPLTLSMLTDVTVATDRSSLQRRMERAAADNHRLQGLRLEQLPPAYLAGTPEQLLDRIGEYQRQGVDRLILKLPDPSDLEMVTLLAEEVLPRLDSASAVDAVASGRGRR